jgi:hypothetical protein
MAKKIIMYSSGAGELSSAQYGISGGSEMNSGGETTSGLLCFSACKESCSSNCSSNCGNKCASRCESQCNASCWRLCTGGADDLTELYENIELVKL